MKRLISLFALTILFVTSFSQKLKVPVATPQVERPSLTRADLQRIKLSEDTLERLSQSIIYDTVMEQRQKACYAFIPKLVRALKLDNSFFYSFDSLQAVSRVYAPDSSFRIFTWQMIFARKISVPAKYSKTGRDTFFEKPTVRYYGMIQMRSKELKMFPLFDASDTLSYGTQEILSANAWFGQLYYNCIQKSIDGKNYYTLFGFEASDQLTRRKIIDILSFDNLGKPRFGAPLFYFKSADTLAAKKVDTLSRFFMEYKWDATTVLNYDKEMEMIVFDHVAPPNDRATGATFTYVPDGTYEGFLWTHNRWNWVEKVFTFAINEDDNPPVPAPLFGQPKHQPQLPKDGDPR